MLCVVFCMFDCWPKHFFAEPRRSTCIAVVFAPRTQSSCVYVCAFDPMPFVDIMYNWHGVRAKWSFSSHFTPRALPSYALLFSHVPLNFSASASPWLWHANGLRVVCPGHKLFRWSHFCSLHTLQPPPFPRLACRSVVCRFVCLPSLTNSVHICVVANACIDFPIIACVSLCVLLLLSQFWPVYCARTLRLPRSCANAKRSVERVSKSTAHQTEGGEAKRLAHDCTFAQPSFGWPTSAGRRIWAFGPAF